MFETHWNNRLHAPCHQIIYKQAMYQSFQIEDLLAPLFPVHLPHYLKSILLSCQKNRVPLTDLYFLSINHYVMYLLTLGLYLLSTATDRPCSYTLVFLLVYTKQLWTSADSYI